jgi:hypothetical protein
MTCFGRVPGAPVLAFFFLSLTEIRGQTGRFPSLFNTTREGSTTLPGAPPFVPEKTMGAPLLCEAKGGIPRKSALDKARGFANCHLPIAICSHFHRLPAISIAIANGAPAYPKIIFGGLFFFQ